MQPRVVSGRLFLLVNLPAEGLVLAKHTAKVPGSRVDSVREDVQEVGYASSQPIASGSLMRFRALGPPLKV